MGDTGMAVLLLLALVCEVVGDQDGVDGLAYLARYGYLTTQDQDTSQNIPQHSPVPGQAQDISQAVTKFQNFAGLKATGVLDQETLELMKTPRCGVQDFYIQSDTTGNVSAPYRTLTKWTSKTVLSWRVTKFSSKLTRSQVVNSVWKAFQFWSSVTNLKFFEKTTGEVDIPIEFVTYDHGDGNPFDGPGGTLAHAYYPETGDIHVDDTEDWTLDSSQGTNFLQTLTREIGHSIGLDHSTNNKAVMFPSYSSTAVNSPFTWMISWELSLCMAALNQPHLPALVAQSPTLLFQASVVLTQTPTLRDAKVQLFLTRSSPGLPAL